MARTEPEAHRYRLGPRSTRGLIAGWRTGQIACVACGLMVAVGTVRAVGGVVGGVLGFAAAGVGVALATWPVGGRTLEQWLPTLARSGANALARTRRRAQSYSPGRTSRGPLSRLEILELPEPREQGPSECNSVGVVGDGELSTWTAVVPVGGTGFALGSEGERDELIAAWAGVLAAMARDAAGLHRLQWMSSTYPAWLEGPLPAAGPGIAGDDYARLLEEASPQLWRHDVYIAVSIRRAGATRGSAQVAGSVLREQLSALDERLRGAGLLPGAALSSRMLAGLVRRAFEVTPTGLPAPWPWPVGVDSRWWHLRTDASWHASYWIAEWPRSEVAGGFLLPMLLEPGLRRVVSVTMAPLPAQKAVRRAERERTEGTADAEMRHRHGFAVTARALREQEGRQRREAELAEGHAGYRYSGYATVTEADPLELEHACSRLEQAAALAQLELRRLFGAQEEGFCCTLPAGRGCR